ncbi:hypothetical protein IPdc08_01391 [archaeon]|nr:hypothetical protein IPdc08_01391 [archaeon]
MLFSIASRSMSIISVITKAILGISIKGLRNFFSLYLIVMCAIFSARSHILSKLSLIFIIALINLRSFATGCWRAVILRVSSSISRFMISLFSSSPITSSAIAISLFLRDSTDLMIASFVSSPSLIVLFLISFNPSSRAFLAI